MLRQIAASGCRQILIGLESSVFRYGGMGGKTPAWQRMIEAVETIQAAGIVVNACFIVGADGETPASIERLGDFLETASMGEIMTDELTSLKFNLTMLSTVSIWRVLLFSRVVAIQFAVPMLAILSWILLPCMMIAFVAALAANMSMVSIMGGIRLTETQQMLVDYQGGVVMICYYGVIPMIVMALVSIGILRGSEDHGQELLPLDGKLDRRVWLLPILATCLLMAGAIVFQPRLYRATEVDALLRNERVVEAIEMMQRDGEQAFPIVWDPPPKFPDRDSQSPTIAQLVSGLETTRCPSWIIERLMVQADEIALRQEGWYQGTRDLNYLLKHFPQYDPEPVTRTIESLQELQQLGIGDQATIAHRAAMLETLERVRQQAEFNADESRQRSNAKEDSPPNMTLDNAPSSLPASPDE